MGQFGVNHEPDTFHKLIVHENINCVEHQPYHKSSVLLQYGGLAKNYKHNPGSNFVGHHVFELAREMHEAENACTSETIPLVHSFMPYRTPLYQLSGIRTR